MDESEKQKSNEKSQNIRISFSSFFLIISNLVVIVLYNVQHWDFYTVIWLFYFQLVLIGFFKIILYVLGRGNPVEKFVYGYIVGGFYAVFLFLFITSLYEKPPRANATDWILIFIVIIIFLCNHFFSFYKHNKQRLYSGNVFFNHILLRILPMWLVLIIINALTQDMKSENIIVLNGLLVFKTLVDLFTHKLEKTEALPSTEQDQPLSETEKRLTRTMICFTFFFATFWVWVIGGIIVLRFSEYSTLRLVIGLIALLISIVYTIYARKKNSEKNQPEK